MPDAPDPPRKIYAFKPKEFERLNAPRPDAPEANTVDAMPAGTPDAPHSPAPAASAPTPAANDVFAIQRQLREREIAAGMDALAPPDRPVRRRRKRDYWLLTILTNGVLIPLALWGYRTGSIMVLVSSAAGVILANVGLWWIMWVLMDDY